MSLVYIIVFTALFSEVFESVYKKITSRKAKLWVVSHTYFLLSVCIFAIALLILAVNAGFFRGIFVSKVIPQKYVPSQPEVQIDTTPKYQEVEEIRPLKEYYDIQAPLNP